MKNKKRLYISVFLGALLGIFCIIGAGMRLGFSGNYLFLFATWYNRFVMGIVIAFISDLKLTKSKANPILRGALFGLIISLALFLSTGLYDTVGFLAGIVYGIIIDFVATKYSKK